MFQSPLRCTSLTTFFAFFSHLGFIKAAAHTEEADIFWSTSGVDLFLGISFFFRPWHLPLLRPALLCRLPRRSATTAGTPHPVSHPSGPLGFSVSLDRDHWAIDHDGPVDHVDDQEDSLKSMGRVFVDQIQSTAASRVRMFREAPLATAQEPWQDLRQA